MKNVDVDPEQITNGSRVEHEEWTDGYRPQLGTVIVQPNGRREVAWDGTSARNPLTHQLAARLVRIA